MENLCPAIRSSNAKKAEQDYCANKQDQTTQMATDRLLYDSNGDPLFMSSEVDMSHL